MYLKTPSPVVWALAAFFSVVYVPDLAAKNPTPEMAISFDIKKDPRPWESGYLTGNRSKVLQEFVRPGESVHAWTELVSHQIDFTRAPLEDFVFVWKKAMTIAAKDAKLREVENNDGSITIVYVSAQFKELGIRRFIDADDGIYVLAYQVRPEFKRDNTLALWWQIVNNATLVKNPLRAR